jgi:hypothetical protein
MIDLQSATGLVLLGGRSMLSSTGAYVDKESSRPIYRLHTVVIDMRTLIGFRAKA